MAERQNIEWKASWRDEYLKWICGFANAQGGVLEIGRDDKGRVVGITDAERLVEDLPNKIRNLLGIVADVDLLQEKGMPFIRITVGAYPFPVSYKGEYHYRTGSTKQMLTGASLDRFLLSKTGKRWDGVPVPHVEVSDLDGLALTGFRQRSTNSRRLDDHVLQESDAVLIERLRLTDGSYLKRAGVLLFHPDPERFVTGAYVKIGYFRTNADLLYQDEVHGDLFTQVDKTMDLLLTKYQRALISYKGIQRIETYSIPEVALREAVLNAIAHKDYASGIPIQISVYSDRLLIWNNGQLPDEWTAEQFVGKHPSQPHNPDIANAFFRAGMIEAWGRGIERILDTCREAGVPRPEFRFDSLGLMVEFRYRDSDIKTSEKPSEKTSEKTSETILRLAAGNRTITIKELAEELGLTTRSIERQLAKLRTSGRLLRIGPDKGGYWKVVDSDS